MAHSLKVQVYGLREWRWGDGDESHALAGGAVHDIETDDDAYAQAILDACEAQVGLRLLELDGAQVAEPIGSTAEPEPPGEAEQPPGEAEPAESEEG